MFIIIVRGVRAMRNSEAHRYSIACRRWYLWLDLQGKLRRRLESSKHLPHLPENLEFLSKRAEGAKRCALRSSGCSWMGIVMKRPREVLNRRESTSAPTPTRRHDLPANDPTYRMISARQGSRTLPEPFERAVERERYGTDGDRSDEGRREKRILADSHVAGCRFAGCFLGDTPCPDNTHTSKDKPVLIDVRLGAFAIRELRERARSRGNADAQLDRRGAARSGAVLRSRDAFSKTGKRTRTLGNS